MQFFEKIEANQSTQRGQIGVIILLIMVVVLTIGLSLASRTTREAFISQQYANSTRVFNAAESGIEQALSGDFSFDGESSGGVLEDFSGTDIDVAYTINKSNQLEMRLFELFSVELDVRGAVDGNQVRIDWSREGDCATEDPASLIAMIFYDDAGESRVRYESIGACDRGDSFNAATSISGDYNWRYDLALQDGDQFVRLKPIYNDTHLWVRGNGWTMPVQSYLIRSEAENQNGDETRAIQVNQSREAAPSIFDFAVFSGNDLVK